MNKALKLMLTCIIVTILTIGCSSNQSSETSQPPLLSTNESNDNLPQTTNDFPNKPISIVTPSNAGAPIDVQSRKLAEVASKYLNNIQINVLNKSGGSGMVAMAHTLSQPEDGYTLHAEATGITSVLQMDGAQFKYTDFIPVSRIELDPFALFVKEDGKFETLEEFIKQAKQSPGKITVGGYGTGTPHHIVAEALAEQAGIEIKWVAFNSGTDAITAVMGDNLDAALTNTSSIPRFEGKVKVLGHTSEAPLKNYSNLKSFKDQGFDIVKYHWRGLFVKAGTPQEIVDHLAIAFNKAILDPDFQDYLDTTGNLPGTIEREDFEKLIHDQAAGDLAILQKLGLVK